MLPVWACNCKDACRCDEFTSCSALCLPNGRDAAQPSLLQPLLGGGGGAASPRSGSVTPRRGAPVRAVVSVGGMQCSCCAVAVEHAVR